MTEQHIKEQISKAYTKVVAAKAGIIYRDFGEMDYGMDGSFSDVEYSNGRYSESGFGIQFQLKATAHITPKDGRLIYDLEVKNYNDLIKNDVGMPRILILYVMPKDKSEWLIINSEYTILKKCAWWYSLKGSKITKNKNRVRIYIPDNQILTVQELKRLMNCVKEGAEL